MNWPSDFTPPPPWRALPGDIPSQLDAGRGDYEWATATQAIGCIIAEEAARYVLDRRSSSDIPTVTMIAIDFWENLARTSAERGVAHALEQLAAA